MDTAVNFALEQASGLENTQMLGHRGERKWERLGEFGDRGFALRKAGENSTAGGVGEGGEGGIERGGGRIVNHMVKYGPAVGRCQAKFLWEERSRSCFLTLLASS